MSSGDTEVAIIGAGAAGIAAGIRLREAGIACLLLEARARLGGRAWTIVDRSGALDLGCGWLHSADRNPWRRIAEAQGRAIDKTPPPWTRVSFVSAFALDQQQQFLDALQSFFGRLQSPPRHADRPAASLLDPGCAWNDAINAVSTYVSGAELERISLHDIARYEDTGVNWRVVEGYGAVIAAHGASLPVALACAVHRVDHGGKRLRIDTAEGTVTADRVIVTLPSAVLAEEAVRFTPALPGKLEAAAGLPLGLADKLFLALDGADAFEKDSRLFGRTDRVATGFYHFRPMGRPQIEAYFGGTLAADLEIAGEGAFFDFARAELSALLGSDFARRVTPIRLHGWKGDPYARGSYSYARPEAARSRALLAAPVDDRLFFAGEACSERDFSSAHGAWETGLAAAEHIMAVRA